MQSMSLFRRACRRASIVLLLFVTNSLSTALAAGVSTQFSLTGFVNATPTIALSDLRALPATSVTVGSDTYVGVSLHAFLSTYLKTDPTVPRNDILRDYVVATGSDGYQAAYSLGELDPAFGNQGSIIAYELNGEALTTSGFARIVAPGDVRAGRWVSNLTSLYVGHVDFTPGSGGVSSSFTVSGAVDSPAVYTLADLPGALAPTTVTVATPPLTGRTFTGVSLWGLLNASGIQLDSSVKNDVLGKIVVATGTDGYQTVFSLGELHPNFGNQPNLLAYADGAGNPLTGDGFARTIVPGDVAKGGRYVSNLVDLKIVDVTPVPLPPAAVLFVAGLASLGLSARRR